MLSHQTAVWKLQVMWLKIGGTHLTCKVANNVWMFVGRCKTWREIKMVSSLPLLSNEPSVQVKENPKLIKKIVGSTKNFTWFIFEYDVSYTVIITVIQSWGFKGTFISTLITLRSRIPLSPRKKNLKIPPALLLGPPHRLLIF